MTPAALRKSCSGRAPPAKLSTPLAALWWAAKNDWNEAHAIVMDASGPDAAWVHAYLHRLEGDLGNARYWYAQAGRSPATGSFESEWDDIAAALLNERARGDAV